MIDYIYVFLAFVNFLLCAAVIKSLFMQNPILLFISASMNIKMILALGYLGAQLTTFWPLLYVGGIPIVIGIIYGIIITSPKRVNAL